MMRPEFENISVEELAINDSFYRYCLDLNDDDVLYWNQYVIKYPSELNKVREARDLVLHLYTALKHREESDHDADETVGPKVSFLKSKSAKKIFLFAAGIASIFIVALLVGKLNHLNSEGALRNDIGIKATDAKKDYFYSTANREKKFILLPDSTKVWLNAGSQLVVDRSFGAGKRRVELTGEALFDVSHDSLLPFIVHTAQYDVKILGTVFNVKAYAGEPVSETSLLQGKVEIQIAKNNRKIILEPNQKAVIEDVIEEKPFSETRKSPLVTRESNFNVRPLSYDRSDSTVLETAWAENKLKFANESFYDLRNRLERWFDVDIQIRDSVAGNYTFTGTFRDESIREVLDALQQAYFFHYSIKDNLITISK